MTATKFILLVEELRKEQKIYFNRNTGPERKREALSKSKRLEKEVDAAIELLKQGEQKELFK